MNEELYENINKLNDEEIYERVKAGFFKEEAYEIAVGILKSRGASVPQVQEGYVKPKISFYKIHPIWFWTLAGLFITVVLRLVKQLMQ